MPLFNLTKAKKILGETGSTNDNKIQRYGSMADNYIYSDLVNVNGVPIPLVVVPTQVEDIATELCVGYFFKYESGDQITADQAESNWDKYFIASYKRPRFFATS